MKNYNVVLMPTAEEGLLAIAEYIAQDNPVRAQSFIVELVDALIKTLSIFPKSGQVYPDYGFDNEIRTFPHGNYLSFYQVNDSEKTVEVLYIFNAKRDIDSFIQGV